MSVIYNVLMEANPDMVRRLVDLAGQDRTPTLDDFVDVPACSLRAHVYLAIGKVRRRVLVELAQSPKLWARTQPELRAISARVTADYQNVPDVARSEWLEEFFHFACEVGQSGRGGAKRQAERLANKKSPAGNMFQLLRRPHEYASALVSLKVARPPPQAEPEDEAFLIVESFYYRLVPLFEHRRFEEDKKKDTLAQHIFDSHDGQGVRDNHRHTDAEHFMNSGEAFVKMLFSLREEVQRHGRVFGIATTQSSEEAFLISARRGRAYLIELGIDDAQLTAWQTAAKASGTLSRAINDGTSLACALTKLRLGLPPVNVWPLLSSPARDDALWQRILVWVQHRHLASQRGEAVLLDNGVLTNVDTEPEVDDRAMVDSSSEQDDADGSGDDAAEGQASAVVGITLRQLKIIVDRGELKMFLEQDPRALTLLPSLRNILQDAVNLSWLALTHQLAGHALVKTFFDANITALLKCLGASLPMDALKLGELADAHGDQDIPYQTLCRHLLADGLDAASVAEEPAEQIPADLSRLHVRMGGLLSRCRQSVSMTSKVTGVDLPSDLPSAATVLHAALIERNSGESKHKLLGECTGLETKRWSDEVLASLSVYQLVCHLHEVYCLSPGKTRSEEPSRREIARRAKHERGFQGGFGPRCLGIISVTSRRRRETHQL